jgi:hypothetical protein
MSEITFDDLNNTYYAIYPNKDLYSIMSLYVLGQKCAVKQFIASPYNRIPSSNLRSSVDYLLNKKILFINICYNQELLEEIISVATSVVIYTTYAYQVETLQKLSEIYPADRFKYKYVSDKSIIEEIVYNTNNTNVLPWFVHVVIDEHYNRNDDSSIFYGLANHVYDVVDKDSYRCISNINHITDKYAKIIDKGISMLCKMEKRISEYQGNFVDGVWCTDNINGNRLPCIIVECSLLHDMKIFDKVVERFGKKIFVIYRYDISLHAWICHCKINKDNPINLLEEMKNIDPYAVGTSKSVIITLYTLKGQTLEKYFSKEYVG